MSLSELCQHGNLDLSGNAVDALVKYFGNQQATGYNMFWSARNSRLEYDVCTAVDDGGGTGWNGQGRGSSS